MKTLTKILGLSVLLGLAGLNVKAQSDTLYFSKTENQKYYMSHSLVDMNDDSIPDVILARYDINKNGKADTYAMFLIGRKDSLNYYTPDNAFGVSVDSNEDGEEDLYFLDTDMNGTLNKRGEFKKERGVVRV